MISFANASGLKFQLKKSLITVSIENQQVFFYFKNLLSRHLFSRLNKSIKFIPVSWYFSKILIKWLQKRFKVGLSTPRSRH